MEINYCPKNGASALIAIKHHSHFRWCAKDLNQSLAWFWIQCKFSVKARANEKIGLNTMNCFDCLWPSFDFGFKDFFSKLLLKFFSTVLWTIIHNYGPIIHNFITWCWRSVLNFKLVTDLQHLLQQRKGSAAMIKTALIKIVSHYVGKFWQRHLS